MERKFFLEQISAQFLVNRIVALLGPRQCGKTTIAKQYISTRPEFQKANYFDLENPVDLKRLESPVTAIEPLEGIIVIDEVQRRPDLFATLRYIHDEQPNKKFLILGSASRDLIRQSSETLAGRISYIEVTPFLATEISDKRDQLWYKGGFPRSFLAPNEDISYEWRREYVKTYIEQDIPAFGVNISSENLRRFWMMLAHYHGQIFNGLEIANSLRISSPTAKSYLDLLAATFMVRILKPWFSNIKKRQVKLPKIYIRDSGMFHYLMDIKNKETLLTSPKLGASWEGFALEQIIQKLRVDQNDCYFWSTHNKAELDLLVTKGDKKIGFEFKYQDAPKLTTSMKIAMEDLKLNQLNVIYPGSVPYNLMDKVLVIGLEEFLSTKN
jgi:predicted AAA+ superfamily ATPase